MPSNLTLQASGLDFPCMLFSVDPLWGPFQTAHILPILAHDFSMFSLVLHLLHLLFSRSWRCAFSHYWVVKEDKDKTYFELVCFLACFFIVFHWLFFCLSQSRLPTWFYNKIQMYRVDVCIRKKHRSWCPRWRKEAEKGCRRWWVLICWVSIRTGSSQVRRVFVVVVLYFLASRQGLSVQ